MNGTNVTTPYYSVLVSHDGSFAVYRLGGQPMHNSATSRAGNLLHQPSPLTVDVYALEDQPRFVPPPWAPDPASSDVRTHLRPTSGYDFSNGVSEDFYIFLLGGSLNEWWNSRAEFLQLTGPVPPLPNYAYGTWFTQ